MIAPGGSAFNKMMMGRLKPNLQQDSFQAGAGMGDPSQGMGNMAQNMGNAAGSMMGSIGPGSNFMNKFNLGSGGAGRAMMGSGGGFSELLGGSGGMGGSIGPSNNFMQKMAFNPMGIPMQKMAFNPLGISGSGMKKMAFNPLGLSASSGVGKALTQGFSGKIGRALGGLFGFGKKKQPQMGGVQGMPMGMPQMQQGMPEGMPDQGMPQEGMPMGADDSQMQIQGGMGPSIGPSMDMNQIMQKFGKKRNQAPAANPNQAIMG